MANTNNNSLFGSFLRMTGLTCAATGVFTLFGGDFALGAACIAVGLVIASVGSSMNENKQFKEWKRQVEAKGLVPEIRRDMTAAVRAYNAYPNSKTLAYIRNLNPEAAKYIEEKTLGQKK
ncbi:MAG: hypothetical protein IKU34_09795 [Clostridia bacterium]|nr:hypothetical protein [Clostridia bacterium]